MNKELKFKLLNGCYVDGDKHADVVEPRNKFLRKTAALGFLNESNAPTIEADKQSLPADLQ